MMEKLAAALLAAAMTVSVGTVAFATPPINESVVRAALPLFNGDIEIGADGVIRLDGEMDYGTITPDMVIPGVDLKDYDPILTDDSGSKANYVADDVVKPGKTYYIPFASFHGFADGINTENPDTSKMLSRILTDKKLAKFSYDKEEGSKLIQSVKLVEKDFENLPQAKGDLGHSLAFEVKLNDFLTDDEQKVAFTTEIKLKDDAKFDMNGTTIYLADGFTFTMGFEFWTNNAVTTTDGEDAMAGDGGAIWKPTKNEEQEYTWEDENNTLATLTYDSDDGQTKMYYKLSTKWDNAYYAEHFADQDAFLYGFIAGPSASSTSRATLQLRVPFVDEDDELTCAEDEIYVYEMDEEGNLTDISNKFTFTEDDSNGYVLETKLRELGTYVVAGPLGAADADEAASAGVHTGIFLDAYM